MELNTEDKEHIRQAVISPQTPYSQQENLVSSAMTNNRVQNTQLTLPSMMETFNLQGRNAVAFDEPQLTLRNHEFFEEPAQFLVSP
jgi:hypothetical protein